MMPFFIVDIQMFIAVLYAYCSIWTDSNNKKSKAFDYKLERQALWKRILKATTSSVTKFIKIAISEATLKVF